MFKKKDYEQKNALSSIMYKQSTSKLILAFVSKLIFISIVFNFAIGTVMSPYWLTNITIMSSYYTANSLAIHLVTTAFSVALSAYLVFYRKNITIEVTDKAVRFMRGGSLQKEYLYFAFAAYELTSHVFKIEGTDVTDNKSLRTINRLSGVVKDYKCDFLSKEQFDEFITRLMSPNLNQPQTQPVNYQFVFSINRETLLQKLKRDTWILIIIAGILILLNARNFMSGNFTYDTLSTISFVLLLLMPLAIIIMNIRFRRTPKRVTLYANKLIVDKKIFRYLDLKQIRATPSVIVGNYVEQGLRKLTLVQKNGRTKEFTVGRTSDLDTGYADLCNELMNIFSDRFVWDVG